MKREPQPKLICVHETRETKVGTECVKCYSFVNEPSNAA